MFFEKVYVYHTIENITRVILNVENSVKQTAISLGYYPVKYIFMFEEIRFNIDSILNMFSQYTVLCRRLQNTRVILKRST